MNHWYSIKGPLWREWRVNRRIILLFLVVLHFDILFNVLFQQLFKAIALLFRYRYDMEPFDEWHQNVLNFYTGQGSNYSSFIVVAVIAAIGFGTFLISRDRLGVLPAYCAVPISRSQIFLSKYVTGIGAILGGVALYYVVTVILGLLTGADWSYTELTFRFILIMCVLIGIFSLCILAATVTGHPLASSIVATVLLLAPNYLSSWTKLMMGKSLSNLMDHLNLFYYLSDRFHLETGYSLFLICGSILLMSLITIYLSLNLFRHNQMEMNGEVFVLSSGMAMIRWIVSIFLALQLTGMILHGSSSSWGLILFIDIILTLILWFLFPGVTTFIKIKMKKA
ncbi:hypothetical protein ACFSO7_15310 [Bacillus sp. CGMCC 1.16607]|uniref:hypothetical protein n=1 Tax=Bacillus sp. CGMCC 1.16607 TaxID=3351842 RepID=UPI0036378AFB